MNQQSFINSSEFNKLHPVKQKIVIELLNSGSFQSPEFVLPQLMNINKELNKRNLSFTKEETALLIRLMKENMTQAEQKKVDLLLDLFQI